MQIATIAKEEQANMISSFWSMLRELESHAENNLDKHFVEGYYRQWNRVTGDNKKPRWLE